MLSIMNDSPSCSKLTFACKWVLAILEQLSYWPANGASAANTA